MFGSLESEARVGARHDDCLTGEGFCGVGRVLEELRVEE